MISGFRRGANEISFKGKAVHFLDCFTLQDGAYRLSRNTENLTTNLSCVTFQKIEYFNITTVQYTQYRENIQCEMSASPKTECCIVKILVQLYKVQTLLFCVRFQHSPQHFVPLLQSEEKLTLFFRRQEKQQQNMSNLLFQFIKCSWSWSLDF